VAYLEHYLARIQHQKSMGLATGIQNDHKRLVLQEDLDPELHVRSTHTHADNNKQESSSQSSLHSPSSSTSSTKSSRISKRALLSYEISENNTVIMEWNYQDLDKLLDSSSDLRSAVTKAMTAAVVGKVVNLYASKGSRDDIYEHDVDAVVDGVSDGTNNNGNIRKLALLKWMKDLWIQRGGSGGGNHHQNHHQNHPPHDKNEHENESNKAFKRQ